MRNETKAAVLLVACALLAATSHARSWTDAQAEVWQAVLDSYAEINAGDVGWSDRWVTPDAVGWGPGYPMPRDRDSLKRWDTYQFSGGRNHLAEYYPVAIVVHDTTAIAHYYISTASEDREGKHTITHGRCTDILVREGASWKFLGWHCGDEPGSD